MNNQTQNTEVNQPDVLERFATMVRQHDVTYDYADDHASWTRGSTQKRAIVALFNAQNHETQCLMVDVWNAIMRAGFDPKFVDQWLWQYPVKKEVAA